VPSIFDPDYIKKMASEVDRLVGEDSAKPQKDPDPPPEQPQPQPMPEPLVQDLDDKRPFLGTLLDTSSILYSKGLGIKSSKDVQRALAAQLATPTTEDDWVIREQQRMDELVEAFSKRGLALYPEELKDFAEHKKGLETRMAAAYGSAWDAVGDPQLNATVSSLALFDHLVDTAKFKDVEESIRVHEAAVARFMKAFPDKSGGKLANFNASSLMALRELAAQHISDPDMPDAEDAAKLLTEIVTGEKDKVDNEAIANFGRLLQREINIGVKQAKLSKFGIRVDREAFDEFGGLDFRVYPFFKDARNKYELLYRNDAIVGNPRYFIRHRLASTVDTRARNSVEDAVQLLSEVTGVLPKEGTVKYLYGLDDEDRVRAVRLILSAKDPRQLPTPKVEEAPAPSAMATQEAYKAQAGREFFTKAPGDSMVLSPHTKFKHWLEKQEAEFLAKVPERVKEVNKLLSGDEVPKEQVWEGLTSAVVKERQDWSRRALDTAFEKLSAAEAKALLMGSHHPLAWGMWLMSAPWEVVSKAVNTPLNWLKKELDLEDSQSLADVVYTGIGKLALAQQVREDQRDLLANWSGARLPKLSVRELGEKIFATSSRAAQWKALAEEYKEKGASLWESALANFAFFQFLGRDLPKDLTQAAVEDPATAVVGMFLPKGARAMQASKLSSLRFLGAGLETVIEPWRAPKVIKGLFSGINPSNVITYGMSARKFRRMLNKMPAEIRAKELAKAQKYAQVARQLGIGNEAYLEVLSNQLAHQNMLLKKGLKLGLDDVKYMLDAAEHGMGPELARMAMLPEKLRGKVPEPLTNVAVRAKLAQHELAQWERGLKTGKMPQTLTQAILDAKEAWHTFDPSRFRKWITEHRAKMEPALEFMSERMGLKPLVQRVRTYFDSLELRSGKITENLEYIKQGEALYRAAKEQRLAVKEKLEFYETMREALDTKMRAYDTILSFERESVKHEWRQTAEILDTLERLSGTDFATKIEARRMYVNKLKVSLDSMERFYRSRREDPGVSLDELAATRQEVELTRKIYEAAKELTPAKLRKGQKLPRIEELKRRLVRESKARQAEHLGKIKRIEETWGRMFNELEAEVASLTRARKLKITDNPPPDVKPIEQGHKSRLSPQSRQFLVRDMTRDWLALHGAATHVPESWGTALQRELRNLRRSIKGRSGKLGKALDNYYHGNLKPGDLDTITVHLSQRLAKHVEWDVPGLGELYERGVAQLRDHMQILRQQLGDDVAGFAFADFLGMHMTGGIRRYQMAIQSQAIHFYVEPHMRRLSRHLDNLAEMEPKERAALVEALDTGRRPNPELYNNAAEMFNALETERHAFLDALESAGLVEKGFVSKMRRGTWNDIYNLANELRSVLPDRPGTIKTAPPLLNWPKFERLNVQRTPKEVRVLYRNPKTGRVVEKKFSVPGRGKSRLRPQNINKAMREANAWIQQQIKYGEFSQQDVLFGGPVRPRDYKHLAYQGAVPATPELRIKAMMGLYSDLIRNKIYYIWGSNAGWVKNPAKGGRLAGPPDVPVDRQGEWIFVEKNNALGPLSGKWVHKQLLRELNAWDEGWRVLERFSEQFREDVLQSPFASTIDKIMRHRGNTAWMRWIYKMRILRNPSVWVTNSLTNRIFDWAMGAKPLSRKWRRAYSDFHRYLEAWEDGVLDQKVKSGELSAEGYQIFKRAMLAGQLSPTIASPVTGMFGHSESRRMKELTRSIRQKRFKRYREVERQLELLEKYEAQLIDGLEMAGKEGHSVPQMEQRLAEVRASIKKTKNKLDKMIEPSPEVFFKDHAKDVAKGLAGMDSAFGDFLDRWYSTIDAASKYASIVSLADQIGVENALRRVGLFHQQYGFVPPHIRVLRHIPVIGSFVPSFGYEAMRIWKNMAKQGPELIGRLVGLPMAWNSAVAFAYSGMTMKDLATVYGTKSEAETLMKMMSTILIPAGDGEWAVINIGKYQMLDVFMNSSGLLRPAVESARESGSAGALAAAAISPFSQFFGTRIETDLLVRMTGIDPWRGEELLYRGAGLGEVGGNFLAGVAQVFTPAVAGRVYNEFISPNPPSPSTEHERRMYERVLSVLFGLSTTHVTPKTAAARIAMRYMDDGSVKSMFADMKTEAAELVKSKGWLAHVALKEGDYAKFKEIIEQGSKEVAKASEKKVWADGVWIDVGLSEKEAAKRLMDYATRNTFATLDRVPIKNYPRFLLHLSTSEVADKEHVDYAWERLLDRKRLQQQNDPTKLLAALQQSIGIMRRTQSEELKVKFAIATRNLYMQLINAIVNETKRSNKGRAVLKFLQSPRGKRLKAIVDLIK